MIRTVPESSDVTVRVETSLTHLCPFVDEIDDGSVVIEWKPCGQTFEMHELAHYLAKFANTRLSHEQVTDRIRHDLSTVLGVELVNVTTRWDTAGMEVTCDTSQTHQPNACVTP